MVSTLIIKLSFPNYNVYFHWWEEPGLAFDIALHLGLIGMMLIIMGIILYIANKRYDGKIAVEDIGFKRSFFIGLSQALSIIPGVSRSEITMTTGLFSDLSKEGTARFSFLLSTPIILGAGLLKLKDLVLPPEELALLFAVICFGVSPF